MIKEYIASAAKFTSDTNTPVLLNYEMTQHMVKVRERKTDYRNPCFLVIW
jgi:hypothetical protein